MTEERFMPACTDDYDGGLIGYVTLNFTELLEVFGPPQEGYDYKVSSEWVIRDMRSGSVFALYDYKETELYESDLPSVEDFRKQPDYNWHIGGSRKHFNYVAFNDFMTAKLGRKVACEMCGW